MGRKEKRAEKAKVKLKGHTTQFLPKGLNVTKTAFKVRKIVLQQQIKTHDGDQPLSKRKLNIKEVLARLQHYSSSQRLEGLVGLTDVISQMNMEQLLSHLSSIIDSLGRMSLDDESKVRKQSAHILTSVFSLVNETQLLPFSATLGSYLSCAMTHIKLGIQEDSLLLLDALLEKAPALAASSVHQLLPCVLDMISRSRSNHATRQLSIQLSSNLVSSIWRAKVFGRLQALLVASISHRKEPGTQHTITLNRAYHTASTLTLTVDPRKQFHFPIYNKINAVPVSLNKIFHKSSVTTKQLLDNVTQLRGFVESIMPLMLDSWMEVNPISSKKSNQKTEDHGLQMETALILHCVLEIIELLWQHIILWDKNNSQHELTDWFTATFANDVNRFLGKGFPYSARVSFSIDDLENESQGEGRKSNKKNQETSAELSLFHLASPSLLKDKDELSCTEGIAKCVLQNLTLSHLLLNINKSPPKEVQEKILDTLTEYLNQWGGSLLAWSDHLFRTIRSVFYSGIAWEVDLSPFLLAVVSRYNRSASKKQASHQKFASKLCDLLVELSLHENFQHLLGFESFTSWFSQLAHSLSNGNVTIDKLCVLNQLACHNNAAFLQGFQTAFTSLLDAVKNFHLAEGENKSVKEAGLASLFFWVSDWNDEQIEALKTVLVSENCSPSLALKIVNILLLRSEKFAVLAGASSWLVG